MAQSVHSVADGLRPIGSHCIHKLRDRANLEEAARALLKHLGELKRPYLTQVEEKLLSLIEQEFGV
ncbi:hypothetical protein [Nostoc parmelioides]|uniref:Uncharacterized protein n=1 Tax=Nostoc parmelioides FACHB-3921 TaxID=2692909 RepID=A0ABR8BQ09_9NOSO|nr:hypothetical protein [Nostoc parmelioides]MBD2255008.1 hypothetical protein [Nostoc parmelioides FACHB-3921]